MTKQSQPTKKHSSDGEMSSTKQFLLSLLATTISIALTFGTAAIIDHNKQKKEKREIVMMVIYDMYNTLELIEKADNNVCRALQIQKQIADDTTLFDSLKYQFVYLTPVVNYTETTEKIFSSNIETINTVGNVLFTENVAGFYQERNLYKTMVSDSSTIRFSHEMPYRNLKALLDFGYCFDVILSHEILMDMQHTYAQCKQMMNVSDKDIEAYREERMKLDEEMNEKRKSKESFRVSVLKIQSEIDAAKRKLHLK